MAGWRDRWQVAVASDVSELDGLGWEFTGRDQPDLWAVFREDGGPFPVFSLSRGDGDLPPPDDLRAMTEEAVADLLAAAALPDTVGWIGRNISAALMMASLEIVSWEGEEWALESDVDEPLDWADSRDARVPYDWLRARSTTSEALIGTYQDDFVFGLDFLSNRERRLPEPDVGSLRSRRNIPLVTGRIDQVEVVYDTLVEGGSCPGLVTEVLLSGDTGSTLLIAAEAYTRTNWSPYDESVVALADTATADALEWVPARQPWRPTGQRRSEP